MLRLLQTVFIIGFFLVMMTLLVRDHVIPEFQRSGTIEIDSEVMTDSWVNQDEWLSVELGGMELGAARLVASHEGALGEYHLMAHLEVDTMLFRARVLSAAVLDRRLRLQQFRGRVHLPGTGRELLPPAVVDGEELPEGTLEAVGRVEGSAMQLRFRRGDAVQYTAVRLARPVTLADSLTPIVRSEMLSKGVTYSTEVYDPLWGSRAGQVEVEYVEDRVETVDGEEAELRVVEQRLGNQRAILHVHPDGRILRRTYPLLDGGGPIAGLDRDATLVLSLADPGEARREYPALEYIPRLPELEPGEMTGTDHGRVLPSMSLFDLLSQGGPLRNLTGQSRD